MRFFKKIFGILLVTLDTFLFIALISYSQNDPSLLQAKDGAVSNLAGIYGAYIADPIVQSFGYSILILILFIYIDGKRYIFGHSTKYFVIRFSLVFCAIFSFAVFLSSIESILNTNNIVNRFPNVSDQFGIGGFIGHYWYGTFSADITEDIVILASGISFIVSALLCLGIAPREWWRFFRLIIKLLKIPLLTCIKVLKGFVYFTPKIFSYNKKDKISIRDDKEEVGSIFATCQDDEQSHKKINMKDSDTLYKQKSIPKSTSPASYGGDNFTLPPVSLLQLQKDLSSHFISKKDIEEQTALLTQVLSDFGIRGKIVAVYTGPVVTLYELKPAAGTKSSRVIGLADDIARSIGAISVRIAVIVGKDALGIELPNKTRETVYLRAMLETSAYKSTDFNLPLVLGKNISGEPIVADLARMPHLLVAGTTGSGKSVAINAMILSLLYKYSPKDCRIMMIDPKMLELSVYEGIPHLIAPVVTNPKKAIFALKLVVKEMELRYRTMSILGIRNILGYNQFVKTAIEKDLPMEKKIQIGFDQDTGQPLFETINIKREKLPFIVVIIDEIADLMLVSGKEIEMYIQRLAQMARAAGIHIIMATQRPSVDVITGVIKANLPTRISFQVTSKIDSRTILGEQGAEQLLGMGDMLYMIPGGRIERIHSPFVHDSEVHNVVTFLKKNSSPQYLANFASELQSISEDDESDMYNITPLSNDKNIDTLYDKAVSIVLKERKATTSYLQRCLKIGYNRAALLIERMEREEIVSSPNHMGKREILKDE